MLHCARSTSFWVSGSARQLIAAARLPSSAQERTEALALLAQRKGEPAALAGLSAAAVQALAVDLGAARDRAAACALHRVRQEAEEAAAAGLAEQQACSVCLDRPKDMAFGCGHRLCAACAMLQPSCPECRAVVVLRLQLY